MSEPIPAEAVVAALDKLMADRDNWKLVAERNEAEVARLREQVAGMERVVTMARYVVRHGEAPVALFAAVRDYDAAEHAATEPGHAKSEPPGLGIDAATPSGVGPAEPVATVGVER